MHTLLLVSSLLVGLLAPSISSAQAGGADRGAQVFAENKCSACHAVAGKGNAKGPLDEVASKLSAAELRQWITDAPTMAAKTKAQRKPPMKAFAQLPPADLDGLVAYLQSLKK
jgi:mono/diheme cytochrome c family protein